MNFFSQVNECRGRGDHRHETSLAVPRDVFAEGERDDRAQRAIRASRDRLGGLPRSLVDSSENQFRARHGELRDG